MSAPKIATNKVRVLVDDESFDADGYSPLYVIGQKWPADMRGAEIACARLTVADYLSLTSLDVTLQDSDDGDNWDDWVSFTSVTADGSEILDLDEERSPKRFIRAHIETEDQGSATVRVELDYRQIGSRGEYADGVRDVPQPD